MTLEERLQGEAGREPKVTDGRDPGSLWDGGGVGWGGMSCPQLPCFSEAKLCTRITPFLNLHLVDIY